MAKRPAVEEALLAAGEPEEEEILSVREELKKQLWLAGPMIAGALLQNVIQMVSVSCTWATSASSLSPAPPWPTLSPPSPA